MPLDVSSIKFYVRRTTSDHHLAFMFQLYSNVESLKRRWLLPFDDVRLRSAACSRSPANPHSVVVCVISRTSNTGFGARQWKWCRRRSSRMDSLHRNIYLLNFLAMERPHPSHWLHNHRMLQMLDIASLLFVLQIRSPISGMVIAHAEWRPNDDAKK